MKKFYNPNCELFSLKQTAHFLRQRNSFIILTHASPDGDTLGSAFALYYGLKKIGKTAQILCPEKIPEKYRYFTCQTETIAPDDATVIAVDIGDNRLMGDLATTFGNRVDLCIDHHCSNTGYAKRLLLDSHAAATCELMTMLLQKMKISMDDVMAQALYTGLVTDTGCFKYAAVTATTHRIAADLYRFKLNAAEINRLMFDTKSRRLMDLERMVLDGAEYHFNNRCMLLCVTTEMQEKTGCYGTELEGIAVISRSVEGVLAGVTVKQTAEREFKVSLRTYPPLNAAKICGQLNGGGHANAAGATVSGSLEQVKETVLAAVSAALEDADAGTSAAG